MYLIPKSEVTIDTVKFYGETSGINAVEIEQSVETIGSTAKITLPREFAKRQGKGILDFIHRGDKASVRLGYGGDMAEEFAGYVTGISDTTPLVVTLEDEWYTHKRSKPLNRAWSKTSLSEVLAFAFPEYTVTAPDVALPGGYVIMNATPFEVAKGLRESIGFMCRLDAEKRELSCFWAYSFKGFSTYSYVFGSRNKETMERLSAAGLKPNIAGNDLSFVRRDTNKIHITAKSKDKSGKQITVTVGSTASDADKRTLNFFDETPDTLKEKAETRLKRMSYDGYKGSITTFGVPRLAAGDAAKIVDGDNPEREGTYLVKSVKITYSVAAGYRRTAELSYKV